MKRIASNLVAPDITILDAINRMDRSPIKIILVVDQHGRLLGTVTDGDIRRAILNAVTLDSPVSDIMNRNPLVLEHQSDLAAVITQAQNRMLRYVPVLDAEGRVADLETVSELEQELQRRDNLVVLMAGGLGTRLAPLTEDTPKPMLKVGDKPILETIIERFVDHGFHRFCISLNYKGDMIKEYFGEGDKWGADISYVRETERRGTAGALALLPERPKAPFLMMNGDLLTNVGFVNLLDFHQQQGALASIGVREYDLQVPYGTVSVDGVDTLGLEEKPVFRFFVNAGIYCLDPRVLDFVPDEGWLDMPDLLNRLIKSEEKVCSFPIHEYWIDIGRMEDFDRAQGEYNKVFND
jgi:dTDP-glucose pyrophosphorylase